MRLVKYIFSTMAAIITTINIAASQSHIRPEQIVKGDSVSILFQVGKYNLLPTLNGNSRALLQLTDSLRLSYETKYLIYSLSDIRITGSASPEGSIRWNNILSKRRAEAIKEYILRHSPLPDSLIKYEFTGRNWSGLHEIALKDASIPYRDETMEVIGSNAGSDKKLEQLKGLHNGEPYRYMLARIFPQLRSTKVYMEYSREPKLPQLPSLRRGAFVPAYTAAGHGILPVRVTEVADEPQEGKFWFAVKSNLLYDALITPNIGIEFNIDKERRYSVAANWMYAWWKSYPSSWYHRTYGGDIELRRWLGKEIAQRPFTGWHGGIYAQIVTYDFEWGGRGYLGDRWSWAAGVAGGWSKAVGKRLNLDFNLGIGYMWGEYMEYLPIDDCYVWQATKQRRWFGPTKAEVSLVWILGRW